MSEDLTTETISEDVLDGETTETIETTETTTETTETAEVTENTESVPLEFINNPELKTEKSLEKFKTADDLAKSYVHLNKLLGKKISDMNDSEIAHMHNMLGVPETPDDYMVELEGADTSRIDAFKNIAKDARLTKDQFETLVQTVYTQELAQQEEFAKQRQHQYSEWKNELKQEFGNAFDDKIKVANSALKAYDPDKEALNVFKDYGIASHPAVVRLLANLGSDLSEDKRIEGNNSNSFAITPAEADAKISQIRSMYREAISNRSHPDHGFAMAELTKLYDAKKAR